MSTRGRGIPTRETPTEMQILDQSDKYVRLAPTVLFRVPECYLSKKPDLSSERCWLCPVKKQCEQRQPVEKR